MENCPTVLLVENDPVIRQLMVRYLIQAGFPVIEAADGADALDRIGPDSRSIEILVTDVVMPRKDGFTLAAELAKRVPDARVLFVTGHAHDMSRVRIGLEQSRCHVLLKPFTSRQFVAAVQGLLNSQLQGVQPRAIRFVEAVPLLYRVVDQDGSQSWRRGLTLDISRTGLLLEAAEPLPVGATAELVFEPPVSLADELGAGEVDVLAEVIRRAPGTPQVPYPAAVRFLSVRPAGGVRALWALDSVSRDTPLRH